MKPRKPIRRVSKKRVSINREYDKLRNKYLEDHPYCEYWLTERGLSKYDVDIFTGKVYPGNEHSMVFAEPSVEIHHRKGRGKFLLDTSTWMAVSRTGHEMIHKFPKLSYQLGYMLPRNK